MFNISQKKCSSHIVVVDVGCRWGFADKFKNCANVKMYGFDPDREECERLQKLYLGCDDIKLISKALSHDGREKTIYLTKEPACSSMYKPNKTLSESYVGLDCIKEISQIKISTITLDKWTKKEKINRIDYLKIDTQGSELDILRGGRKILSTISFIEVEVEFNPIYDGQPIFSDVDAFLRRYGFVLWRLSNISHYGREGDADLDLGLESVNYDHNRFQYPSRGGQIYWADAFYVKKEIVDLSYTKKSSKKAERDMQLAKTLGFTDLYEKLKKHIDGRQCND